MRINIITVLNGVGLEKDANLLKRFISNEHKINIIDGKRYHSAPFADLTLHLELLFPRMLRSAKRNVFIPNPEWYEASTDNYINQFTEIWVKTYDAQKIFEKKHSKVRLLGFTSGLEFTDGEKSKAFVHIAGKSLNKGTDAVIRAFKDTSLPLYIVGSRHFNTYGVKNIAQSNGYLTKELLQKVKQDFLFHVCCSEYEGFGHYLHEGLCNGIVLTTDAPPMNEWVTDERLLIKVKRTSQQSVATLQHIDENDLRQKALELYRLKPNDYLRIMAENRKEETKRHEQFIKILNNYINEF